MALSTHRAEIDGLDAELVSLYCRRMEVAAAIAAYKQAHGLPVLDAAREAAVLDKVATLAGAPLDGYVRTLYGTILQTSRDYQHALTGLRPPQGEATAQARKYGLIGKGLAHSRSVEVHALLAPYAYALYPLEPDAVAAFIRRPDIGGLNVTLPYKQLVVPLCDALSPQAARIGSVNTLVYGADGGITGHNTDYAGFAAMAAAAGLSLRGFKVVILGSGGTALTAAQVAMDAGAREVVLISRAGPEHYGNLHRHADADILVNATPVGMYPALEGMPVSLDSFPRLCGVLDVIYNPLRTQLLLEARDRGIPAGGGLSMLVAQAAASAALFLGAPVPPAREANALRMLSRDAENIVLIGMPGCGKTCVGQALAALCGRPLWDTDTWVAAQAGKPIEAIFAEDGEEAFRALERKAVREAGAQGGVVVATGGGTVLDAENVALLRQNGRLVLLQRPLPWLATEGRPLSVDIEAMARVRMPIYRAASDALVQNNDTLEAAAQRVLEVLA